MVRANGRSWDELRPVTIEPGYLKYPAGSVLISFGDTKVICTVSVEDKIPSFLEEKEVVQGWLTAEYCLLPGAGLIRNSRAGYGSTQVKGRVHEIQRFIGRALRAAIDLKVLGPRTLAIDCDVIQADGGTRTASVTGAMVALQMAVWKLLRDGKIEKSPILSPVAAVSVGVIGGEVLLDLDYTEDSEAETDLNIVMTHEGRFVEVQGTGEKGLFSREQLYAMLDVGEKGLKKLFEIQKKVMSGFM